MPVIGDCFLPNLLPFLVMDEDYDKSTAATCMPLQLITRVEFAVAMKARSASTLARHHGSRHRTTDLMAAVSGRDGELANDRQESI